MASASWLTSLKCSMESPGTAKHWLEFIFLSPCPQRLLLSVVDLLFLLTLFVIAVLKLVSRFKNGHRNSSVSSIHKPLLESENSHFKATLLFRVSLTLTALLGLYQTVVTILAFTEALQSPWNFAEAFFRLFQAITYVSLSALIAHEKKFGVLFHHLSLRIYWIVSLVIATLFAASAVARVFFIEEKFVLDVRIDDLFSLVSFPVHVFFFIVAVKGSSGIILVVQEDLSHESSIDGGSNVSGYATASLLSKAMWLWMNPVLNEGYKSPLSLDKVPLLPPQFKAEKTAEIFEKHWPKPGENVRNQARTALIRCFWKPLALTALIALVRLLVQYTGPILIQSFVNFTAGDRSNIFEGYYLVLILLMSKIVEVFCSHHLNFIVGNLGMLIRSSLIAALYKKGLRLSCSSRQAHGVGQIVNYMAVDTQQLFDMMPQLHSLWTTPLQVIVSLILLYNYIGLSMLVSFAAIIATMIFTLMITSKNGFYQFNAMKTRDSRLKTTSELLNNMRVIKFQAWEEHFRKRIQSFRDAEFGWVTKFLYLVSCNLTVLWSVPILISALTFTVATLTNVNLSSGTVFTITSILRILQEPIRTFPQSLISVSQALISLTRLDVYLKSNELDTDAVERKEGCDSNVAVEVRDGCFSWEDEGGEQVLKDINFNVNKGDLAAIVGTVGSGKSSLLAAVLGELKKTDGTVRVCGTTAYVAQSSWICNATIQENILFGSPMDVQKYKDVIKVCALEKDLEIMEYGDKTEIGERGINLSGGQKQRIQLARAVYQDCDIYLLDDIFSAVDAHTGSEIFKECVRGALKNKTILLVTHQVDFLHNADIIMVMRDGKIVQSGKYEELLESGLDFGDLVAAHETSVDLVEKSTHLSNGNLEKTPISPHPKTPKSPGKQLSLGEEPNGESHPDNGSSKLIEDEERETGHVSGDVYKQYCTEAYGWWGVAGVVLASLLWQASLMAGDYWLAYETSEDHFNPRLFIKVYVGIAIVSCVLVSIRSFIVTFIGLKTAQMFFQQLLNSTLHAPMSFFDTTPSGRILSRVSSDQVNIDILIPLFMSLTIAMYFTLLSILFITCQYAWPTVFLMIPLAWLNIWYRRYYLASSRELTRLEGITKAPVIHHFSETISGVMTIRCYRKEDEFFQESFDRLNANLQMIFHNNASNEWLGIRMEMLGSLLLCISTLFMVLLPATIIKPEYVGLSLSYGLSLNGILYWAVYMSCFVENRMVSVERIKQFVNIPSEAAWNLINSSSSPPNWPHHGDIQTTSLQVRYRVNTPLVLKGISVSIRGGEKIGVVGRTGSGKSTLIQVFFRLIEPCGGSIVIDGIDISKLGLHYLRSRFGIIPQEPVLFEGSIRSNIDPIGLYSDDEIWKSLDRCQLKDVVAAKPEKLDSLVVDGGDNYSVGQRQLLCLGRVMLKRSKILFMDEATASVDSQTDAVIQKIIREDFTTSTIITIAHRIPTVIDCDRVLVIDDGLAKEFDTPSSLLGRRSLFAALVQEYSNRSNDL